MMVRQIISKVRHFIENRYLFILLNDNQIKLCIFEEIQTYLGGSLFSGHGVVQNRQLANIYRAMLLLLHSVDYAVARCLHVRPPVICLSHAGILSKRLNISSNFFFTFGQPRHSSCSTPNGMAIFQRGTPNRGVECRGYEKIAIFDQYLALCYLKNDTRQSHNMECEQKTTPKLSNDTISNDLQSVTQILRSRHYLTLNTSETV